jgi:hypothetical protein
MKRTELKRRTPLERKPSTLKRRPVSPASSGQRAKIRGAVSIVSGEHGTEPAHVFPRGLGGCDDPLCVVPLTRGEHREYDLGELDLLPFLIAHGLVDELAHALGHARGDLLGLASILTGVRWVPEGERDAA